MKKRHVRWCSKLRAWQDVGQDSYWTYSEMLGWVQHKKDEIEWIRAGGLRRVAVSG